MVFYIKYGVLIVAFYNMPSVLLYNPLAPPRPKEWGGGGRLLSKTDGILEIATIANPIPIWYSTSYFKWGLFYPHPSAPLGKG